MIAIISIIFFFFPVFSILPIFLGLSLDKKYERIYAIFFSIIVAIILYYMIPDTDMDLYRYYRTMNEFSNMSLMKFWQAYGTSAELLANFVLFLFSKFHNNSLIMVFTTLTSYGIIFYILFDYLKITKLGKIERLSILCFVLSTFLIVYNITGFRFCLARLIFFLAIYLDYFKNQKNIITKILYIIPIFIHSSSVTLVLVRMFMFLFKNNIGFKETIIILLISISPNYIIAILSHFTNISFLSTLSSRAEIYLSGAYSGMSNIYLLQLALMFFLLGIVLYEKKKRIGNQKFINFSLIILLISLFYIKTNSIATRFILISTTNSFIFLQDILGKLKPKNRLVIISAMLAFTFMYLLYQIISLRDVVGYGGLVREGLLKNIIQLLLRK